MSRDADMRFVHCKCSLHLAHAGGVLRHAPLWWRSAGTGGREAAGGGMFLRRGRQTPNPPRKSSQSFTFSSFRQSCYESVRGAIGMRSVCDDGLMSH